MSSIIVRGSKLYAKVKAVDGTWKRVATGLSVGQEEQARQLVADVERTIATQRTAITELGGNVNVVTVATYGAKWLAGRDTETVRDDRSRFDNHIAPALGSMPLAQLRPRHVRDFVEALRRKPKLGNLRKDGTRVATNELIAPRTVLHVYGTLRAMLNDAVADELIASSPCIMKTGELPAKVDKDRTWRRTAVFGRSEVEAIVSAPPDAVPTDRRVLYAVMFLGAMRFGEVAALTWRDYDASAEPLGRLVVEKSYSSKSKQVKGTKTDNPREMPVHPLLARILAEWKLGGFEVYTGRKPTPDDLIVPSRRNRPRNVNHMLRRFHEDLERVGLRERRQHDARRTFISIARADGARGDILKTATHGPTGDIIDQYTTLPWATLCAEVAKARFELVAGRVIELPIVRVANGDPVATNDRGPVEVHTAKSATSLVLLAERTGLEGDDLGTQRQSVTQSTVPRLVTAAPSSTTCSSVGPERGPTAQALTAAAAAWSRTGDRRALRRALLQLAADLDGDDS